ncbi:hypothetical protein [Bradyrhizobium brasilense]|uniref:Uncharacterized protein n=1 Tax=Bradyrhizobium brasilense TaxID=1419277 RepID=A0ABY8JFW0_9BRAD|nr:hypothetical protein [Bradyrhizobium brasilense]WFU62682.1 hypothetical protein QA636_35420 [Bradyrhizobium brasilense]
MAFFYLSLPSKPTIDARSLCPVDGPQGVTVVLVDTSDDLPAASVREVDGILDDLITSLPPYHRLDIRVLDIQGNRSRSLFAKCNPGDGIGLSEWTDNPRLARMRWIDSFRKPAHEAVKSSLASAKANSSPIMAAIQDIALDQFSSDHSKSIKKTLVVISDMIEHTRDYSQYRNPDLSFARFRQSPAYLKYRTDLHQALVTINYVTRPAVMADTTRHATFWEAWVKDNSGVLVAIHRLQGT